MLYSPQRCGLSDGEVMECLWSYLWRFSRMTKEMRPAHRLDVLSHALLYYGIMRKQSLGTKVCYSIVYPDPFIAGLLAQTTLEESQGHK